MNSILSGVGRRVVIGLVAFIISGMSSWAVEITVDQAKTAVGNWVRRSPNPLESRVGQTVRDAKTYKNGKGEALFHVVRLVEGGFVVTAADDGILPIIAFSENEDLVVDERNPFWVLLNRDLPQRKTRAKMIQPQRQLQGLAPQSGAGTPEMEWAALLSVQPIGTLGLSSVSDVRVSPLVQSKWSQSTVSGYNTYNYYTPNNDVCGCVATAGSQIMRYHQWPTASVSAGTYTCFLDGTATSLTMKGGTYSWANMPLVPSSSITLTQRQAIGKLTYDAGVASYMQYTSGESGAQDSNLTKAFVNRFGYASACIIMNQTSGVDGYLQRAVLSNLEAGYPVLFGVRGYDSTSGDPIGHEVVGDGYGYSSSTLYVHLNMGWAGSDDAWYNLPAVDSDPAFSLLGSIVFNIFPSHAGEIISGRVMNGSGTPVSGASVVAVNETTGTTLPAVTSNAKGIYAVLVPKPTSLATHSYRLTATSASLTGTQNTTVTASASTSTTYNESTGAGTYYQGTGSVGNQWGVNLALTAASVPSAPTDVSAGDGTSTASVTVSWTASSGATGYSVYRGTSSSSSSSSLLDSVSGTSYTDSTATPGALNYYWVKASNSVGASSFSSSDTGYRALSVPTGVTASDTASDSIAVSWNSVTGASYYRVYRATSSSGTKTALGSWQTSQSYADASATAGTTYYYWVVAAVDSSGTRASAYSAYDTGALQQAAPSAPTDVSASDGKDGVIVSWTASVGATGYYVYRSTTNNTSSASFVHYINSQTNYYDSTYSSNPIKPGTLYFYWVKAENGVGISGFSVSDSGYSLGAPSPSATKTETNAVIVTWSAVTGATHYRVSRATSKDGAKTELGNWQTALRYTDTSAMVGTTYYYWVRAAVDSSGTLASVYGDYPCTGFVSALVTIIFDAEGGTVTPTSKVVFTGADYGTLPVPTYAGYRPAGWWTGDNGTGREVRSNTIVTNGASRTLHAKWGLDSDPVFEQSAKLTAYDGASGDIFGSSVAIAGDFMVVGACKDNDKGYQSGSAYVFVRQGTNWLQQAKLSANDGTSENYFGCEVAIAGDTLVVGAYGKDSCKGAAYVFVRQETNWVQQAKLTASDGVASDYFGCSVAISADTVVVGANWNNGDKGASYVFVRQGTNWSQQAKLTAIDGAVQDLFGCSVAISGNTLVVGAAWDDDTGYDAGSAYVFVRQDSSWAQQAKLTASNGTVSGMFGGAVAISSDTVVVGARNGYAGGHYGGGAYIFVRQENSWIQQKELIASASEGGERFGESVSISGDIAIIGSPQDYEKGVYAGAAYVFIRQGTCWVQQPKITASDGAAQDYFGTSVSVSGDTVVLGASGDDNKGSAYILELTSSSPEIDIQGNGFSITDEDSTPSMTDHTDFGSVAVPSGVVSRTFTIHNTGTASLTLTGNPCVSLSGTHAAEFTVTTQPTTPVAAGGTATFTVRFAPTAFGTRTATLSIANNDSDQNLFSFSISGIGLDSAALDYDYTITNGTVTVTGYKGLGGNVTVPASIEGFPVTVVGESAFGVCFSLTTLTVPNSVTIIQDCAFYRCTNLTSVAISANVTNIGISAFSECDSLTNIIVSSSNPAYSSVDGVLFDKARTCLVSYPGGKIDPYTIPYGTVSIGEEAFAECYRLMGVTIPDSVTMIGGDAFFCCSSLATVAIPDSVTMIGESPFIGCASLTNIAVSCSNPAYSSVDGVLFDKARTCLVSYPGGKTDTYQIPEGTENIGAGAFSWCPYLADVIIPDSVTNIGAYAFVLCESLERVMLGTGVAFIDDAVFYGCSGLTDVYFKGDVPLLGGTDVFNDSDPTVYYVDGTAGWGSTFGGLATAVWTCMAIFDADGGAASFAERNYDVGRAYGELPTASRSDGVFRGWRTAAGGGGAPVTTNTPVPYVTAGHALYAEWAPLAPVISPTNGMVYNATAQKVTITCATAGAEIRFTTNGVDPTVESALYTKAFNIYATTTVKAKAFMSGMTPSDLAAAVISKYVSLAEALNIPVLTVTTDGLTPWVAQTAVTHDGLSAARSGAIGNGGATWMQTTVSNAGTVSFWWKASCEDDDYADDWDYLVFLVDGIEKKRLDGITGWQQVTVALGAGEHALRWEYRKDSDGLDGDDCGWVDQVAWAPAGGNTTTTEVPVPYTWLDAYGLVTGGDYEAAANLDIDGDGHSAWQEYVAGSQPTNKDSVLRAYLGFTNGTPVLQWTPDLGTARLYTVEGKASLTNATWTTPTNEATRFFRVKTSLK